MIEIEKPNIECVAKSDDNTYGKYVVEPLEISLEQSDHRNAEDGGHERHHGHRRVHARVHSYGVPAHAHVRYHAQHDEPWRYRPGCRYDRR